ncbi:uncharacterized protein LOC132302355 [Cornus florida]|uniref:uncharacterized protein LOC132302355 n=1 Tax=Cornus florida TaxID=4283 RepID=UPI00289D0AD7|nr:uncharacterized protein LOC132302355 [Cornus florida]
MALFRKAATAFAMSVHRLHRHHGLTAFSPFAAHCFSTGYPSNPCHPNNPFRTPTHEVKMVDDSYICVRIDVPGLTSNELKMSLDKHNFIRYEGKCKSEAEYEDEGRWYGGTIECSPKDCHMDLLKAELKHGVIWISMPLNEETKTRLKKLRQLGLLKRV